MKKLLLSTLTAMLTLVVLRATPVPLAKRMDASRLLPRTGKTEAAALQPAKAATNGFDIAFCDEMYSWIYLLEQNQVNYKCYIYIPPERATEVAGNRITSLSFSSSTDFDQAPTRDGLVFVTESLKGPFTDSTRCTIYDSYSLYQQTGTPYQTVALETPYTIKANTGFYIGYVVEKCRYSKTGSADWPVGIDGMNPTPYAGTVEIYDYKTGEWVETYDMAEDVGTNLFLTATTKGEAKGFTDLFNLGRVSLGDLGLPIVSGSGLDALSLSLKNLGGNALTEIEYSIDLNQTKGARSVLSVEVPPHSQATVDFPITTCVEGRNNLTLNVYRVNNAPADYASSTAFVLMNGEGYPRRMVVEEATGTWCGWCPRGIVGMDYMAKTYPDVFIGIAVHGGDDMAVDSYDPLLDVFSGFPNCVINRDPVFGEMDPNTAKLKNAYEQVWKHIPGVAKVEMSVKPQSKITYEVSATTTFAYSETGADYRLAFVVLEDGLTDTQTNYYAGRNDLEWWQEQKSSVEWTYSHTARDIFDVDGIKNSVPSTIVKGEPMTFETTLRTANVSDLPNTKMVALLIDGLTGVILNACEVPFSDYNMTAVERPESEADTYAPVEYFNLLGQPVAAPESGTLVIRRQGAKVEKQLYR